MITAVLMTKLFLAVKCVNIHFHTSIKNIFSSRSKVKYNMDIATYGLEINKPVYF